MNKTFLLLLAIAPAAFAADLTGSSTPERSMKSRAARTGHVSRMFVRTVARNPTPQRWTSRPWGQQHDHLDDSGARERFSGRDASAHPEWRGAAASDRGSLERGLRRFLSNPPNLEMDSPVGAHEVVHVMTTMAASYHLDVEMPDGVPGVTVIAAEPDSAIALSTWAAPLSRQPGEPVTLHAEVRDGNMPVPGARVTARLASPGGRAFAAIELVEQADGTYSATLPDLPENAPGTWQVRLEEDGTNATAPFLPHRLGRAVAERGAARSARSGRRALAMSCASGPRSTSSPRRLSPRRARADGARNAIAWGEGVRNLASGATELELDIPLAHLGAVRTDEVPRVRCWDWTR